MKFLKLSTTSKLYLLTLVLIFAIIFLNQAVFAQDQTAQSSTSQKRLKTMELYQSWINSNEYGSFKTDQGKKLLADFTAFLNSTVSKDQNCLTAPMPAASPSFAENINTFFAGLISSGQNQTVPAQPQQLANCKEKIKEDYKLAKKYNRALKYLQIKDGQANICVKADLGVGIALKARGFNPAKAPPAGGSDNSKETGVSEPMQLYLCTGNDGKPKVRVVDDSGTRLRLAPEDAAKNEFKVENLPPKGAFETLLGKLGQ